MKLLAVLAVVALVAGCAAHSPPTAPTPQPAKPPLSFMVATAIPACKDRFNICSEPTVAVMKDGRAFASSVIGGLAISTDGAANWTPVADPPLPTGAPPDVFVNDVQLVASGTTLYYCSILTDSQFVAAANAFVLAGLQVASSPDGGKTWPLNVYLGATSSGSTTVGADRQWLAVAPQGDLYISYLHATPLLTSTPLGVPIPEPSRAVGGQLEVAHSTDGGKSWSAFVPITDRGVLAGGPIVVAPEGSLLVPLMAYSSGEVRVGTSLDQGKTWTLETVAKGDDMGTWFPVLTTLAPDQRFIAWDRAKDNAIVASAWDPAAKVWTAPHVWSEEGSKAEVGPWVADARAGEHDIVWLTENGTDTDRHGDVVLARGNDSGPNTRAILASNVSYFNRGANGDFAHYARFTDGRILAPFAQGPGSKSRVDVAVTVAS